MASPTTTGLDKKAYEAELNAIAKRFGNLEDQTIRELIGSLQDLRKGIAAEVATTEFKAFQLQELQTNIGNLITQFEGQLTQTAGQALAQATSLGARSVTEPLTAAGLEGVFFSPTQAQVNVALDFSAELIQNIVPKMRGDINTQLRLATLGGRSSFEVMKDITAILGPKARDGVWGTRRRPEVVIGVAARGEAILRTEMTRMYNLATHSQQQITAQDFPEIKKRWLATSDRRTRPHHLDAHGQEVPVGKKFKVGSARMEFPGDPSAPASETVNCRCSMITIHPDLETPELPIDKKIADEKAEREKAKAKRRQRQQAAPPPEPRPEDFTPEYWSHKKQVDFLSADPEGRQFYDGELQDELDALTLEQEASDIARRRGFVPGTMNPGQWSTVADDLLQEAGDALELATEAGREAAGRAKVGRRRIQGQGPILQVGGKDVEQRWEGGSKSAAEKATAKINEETAIKAIDFMDKQLIAYGFDKEIVDALPRSHRGRGGGGYGQRRKLINEIATGQLSGDKIGKVPLDVRQAVIDSVPVKDRLFARALSLNPRAGEGLEIFGEYEKAMIKAGRVEEIQQLPDLNIDKLPEYLLRRGKLKVNREPVTTDTIDF